MHKKDNFFSTTFSFFQEPTKIFSEAILQIDKFNIVVPVKGKFSYRIKRVIFMILESHLHQTIATNVKMDRIKYMKIASYLIFSAIFCKHFPYISVAATQSAERTSIKLYIAKNQFKEADDLSEK